jgi:hypothetical protein
MTLTVNMSEKKNNTVPVKREHGKFLPGVSGNPAGRPKGSRNQITLLKESLELQLREQAAPDLPGVLTKAVELALEGDRSMIKLLLELHMAKGVAEKEGAAEKVTIKIETSPPAKSVKPVEIIDAEILPK